MELDSGIAWPAAVFVLLLLSGCGPHHHAEQKVLHTDDGCTYHPDGSGLCLIDGLPQRIPPLRSDDDVTEVDDFCDDVDPAGTVITRCRNRPARDGERRLPLCTERDHDAPCISDGDTEPTITYPDPTPTPSSEPDRVKR
jgi:hypothetical protein